MAVNVALKAIKAAELAKRALKKVSPVQHFTLGSTAISDVWYDATDEVMWVKFQKVKAYPKYRFEGVPGSVLADLLNSSSAGSVYHDKIQGNYHSSTIKGPEGDGTIREQVFNL